MMHRNMDRRKKIIFKTIYCSRQLKRVTYNLNFDNKLEESGTFLGNIDRDDSEFNIFYRVFHSILIPTLFIQIKILHLRKLKLREIISYSRKTV